MGDIVRDDNLYGRTGSKIRVIQWNLSPDTSYKQDTLFCPSAIEVCYFIPEFRALLLSEHFLWVPKRPLIRVPLYMSEKVESKTEMHVLGARTD